MALPTGTRLGSYEIVDALGSGGMGEVYRARDLKLNRLVALKVLPADVSNDPVRLRRLQREAQLLASLNHPQIATIHGLEESAGTCALVMELVEGEDLKARLARGPMPLGEALPVARQIALALDAAHGQGIVHRDLKPANIKLRADGAIKVLDFGLAKGVEPGSFAEPPDDSPTVTTPAAMTESGMVLGTAAYMSPEQARGKVVDKRADIWAFGCVLYELLTGRSPFRGDTVSDTLALLLQREPDWSALPPETPGGIRRLLRRCLEKNLKRRLHDIADAGLEIDDAERAPDEGAAVSAAPAGPRAGVAAKAGLALVALLGAAAAGWFLRPTPDVPERRLELTTPPTTDTSLALSPDGLKIVFVAQSGRTTQLWLRALDASAAEPIKGTERGSAPFWSPDGRSIGFFADAKLKRVDIDGGSSGTLATNCPVPLGGSWGPDGTIIFSASPGGPVRRTTADGAAPMDVTKVEPPQQRGHHYPLFLPDGRQFLFFMTGSPEAHGVWIGALDGRAPRRLLDADGPAYAAGGYLFFVRAGRLYAQRFNSDRGVVTGDPIIVQDEVNVRTSLSVSAAGPIAYRGSPGDRGERQLVWFDRSGRELAKVVYPDTAALGPALSHDGHRIAVFRFVNSNMDIWSYDTTRRLWERITVDPGDDIYPLWSRDDRSLIFAGVRNAAPISLFERLLADPPEGERLLLKSTGGAFPMDWSSDGRFLLYTVRDARRAVDIWVLPLADGRSEPSAVVATEADEGFPQFSPDGKWIAYQSDKTGREEIYVRPFPSQGADVRVSADGGSQPRWNPNGKELFYIGVDDRMTAVSISMPPDGAVRVGEPEDLFPTNAGSTVAFRYRHQYMVSPDAKTFILNTAVDQGSATPIALIINWKPR